MRDYTWCCVCDEPCSQEEATREVAGCYLHICYECALLPDCPACGGGGEVGGEGCDRCGGTGKG